MKKLLLGLITLSSLTFAQGEVFDFYNAEPISDTEFSTNLELDGIFDKGKNAKLIATHDIAGKTNIYEFVKISGNLKYKIERPENTNDSYIKLHDDSSIGLDLDFKEYGVASTKLKKSNEFILGYSNKFDFQGLKTGISANYTLGYGDKISKKGSLTNKGEIKGDISYTILESLKLSAYAKLGLNFDKNIYTPGVGAEADYSNIIRSITKVAYEGNEEATKRKVALSENVSYEIKEETLRIKGLTIKPEIQGDLDIFTNNTTKALDLNVTPKVSANYRITKALSADTSFAVKIKFEKAKSTSLGYTGTETKLSAGLKYIIN